VLTPKGLSEKSRNTIRFLNRKTAEYEALRKEIDQLKREAKQA
jgi:cell shape-determining protein MreC